MNRALQGSTDAEKMLVALVSFQAEMIAANWSLGMLNVAIDSLKTNVENFGEREKEMILEIGVLML